FETGPLAGLGGRPHLLRPRNGFLSQRFTDAGLSVHWAKHQSLSLAAYCPDFVVVPCDPVKGLRIESRSAGEWGGSYLHDRLRAESESLRIMLWPLEIHPDYPGLDGLAAEPPDCLELASPRNEREIQEEILRAIRLARKEKVTLLILPELVLPPGTEEEVRRELARQGMDGHPILTLAGCCHRRNTSGRLHLNEAVLLGPDGSEIHRHRKLAPFTDYRFGERRPIGEVLEAGTQVAVLESCLGNLTPLICLDLLNDTVGEVLHRCHGNLLIVPSMSEETQAHRHHAQTHQFQRLASTFVCNHWFKPLSERSTSFYRVPRKQGLSTHWPATGAPYLLFDLQKSLGRL
ncbi:MAG TPA: nitrilase-related carbon-nitrogen hydrolase, partial [Thermoanaerobaculia bacterium]|nr:nitrilase-related carbon-nitrogen hydrolase [Thermoanaerobaculia bacterium]